MLTMDNVDWASACGTVSKNKVNKRARLPICGRPCVRLRIVFDSESLHCV
jgi:hypothetical protein